MGFYDDQVVPRMINVVCGATLTRALRERACEGLHGDVVEIGFGSGLNVPFYPAAVSRVAAIDPAGVGWKLATKRIKAASVPIEWTGLDGESLPLTDSAWDSALSTWTLCTIPDVVSALAEIRRVLKPGGTLHFLEHGLAPDTSVQRWQHRLEPMQRRLVAGCHLTRPLVRQLTEAGFVITNVDVFYARLTPKFFGAYSLGVATAP